MYSGARPPSRRASMLPDVRLLVRVALAVAANAAALLIAAALLERFEIDTSGFVIALAIFSLLSLPVQPLVTWVVTTPNRVFAAAVGLFITWLVLVITDAISDGIQIEGWWTWVLATIIVWLASLVDELVYNVLLPRTRARTEAADL
jgi:putative membrane protein